MKQDVNGAVTGSRLVPIKDIIEKELADKAMQTKMREIGWDGPAADSFRPIAEQKAAQTALQIKEVEKQASRNCSPSG